MDSFCCATVSACKFFCDISIPVTVKLVGESCTLHGESSGRRKQGQCNKTKSSDDKTGTLASSKSQHHSEIRDQVGLVCTLHLLS